MKKLVAGLLIGALSLSLMACGSKDEGSKDTGNKETSESQESQTITSIADLQGKKVGVQTGTVGDTYACDPVDGVGEENVERYNKGFEAIQALSQGKVSAVIIDDQPAKVFVEQNEDLAILDEVYAEEEYAIVISKDNAELKDKINEALKEIKDNGTFQSIIDYYIGGVEGSAPYEMKADVDRSNGTLTMATNAEFPPYEFYEGSKIIGVDADMAQAIADILGMELVIEDMAFDSIIVAVQGGKADIGVAGLTVTEERLVAIDFSNTYYMGRQVVIVKK